MPKTDTTPPIVDQRPRAVQLANRIKRMTSQIPTVVAEVADARATADAANAAYTGISDDAARLKYHVAQNRLDTKRSIALELASEIRQAATDLDRIVGVA